MTTDHENSPVEGDSEGQLRTFVDDPIEAGCEVFQAVRENPDVNVDSYVVALSGGHDSSTALRFALQAPQITVEEAVHIDTGTGLTLTEEYVIALCQQWGVDLTIIGGQDVREGPEITFSKQRKETVDVGLNESLTLVPAEESDITIRRLPFRRPHESYPYLVRTFGFPGDHPSAHNGMWQNLKDKILSRYERHKEEEVAFISGVRIHESETRYENIPETGWGEVNGSLWLSPLYQFTDEDLAAYRAAHDIPTNDAYDILHASGECLCGAFADRYNLPAIAAIEPATAELIYRLEYDCLDLAARGEIREERVLWAHGSLSPGEYEAYTGDQQRLTCADCEKQCSGPYNPNEVDRALSPAEHVLKTTSLHEYWNRTFYCGVCDIVTTDPYGHRRDVHPFDAETGPAADWDMRMIDPAASDRCDHPISEPNGWNLHVNQLVTDKSKAAIQEHRFYYEDYALSHCNSHDHSWTPHQGGPSRVCEDCGAYYPRDVSLDNQPVLAGPETNKPAFEDTQPEQYTLEAF